MIFAAPQSELSRFKFHSLRLKIPVFNLFMSEKWKCLWIYIWILKTQIRTRKRDYPWIESLSFRKSSKNQNWDYYTKHVCTSHFDHKINHCLPDDNKMQKPYPCGKWLKFNFRTIIENSLTVIEQELPVCCWFITVKWSLLVTRIISSLYLCFANNHKYN